MSSFRNASLKPLDPQILEIERSGADQTRVSQEKMITTKNETVFSQTGWRLFVLSIDIF